MFETLASQIGAVIVCVVCAFAFLKGDEPERFAAGAYMIGWFASLLAQRDGGVSGAQHIMFALDCIMLVVLGTLTWKYRRSWPAWACGFQLLVIMSHIMVLLNLNTAGAAFYTVVNLAGYAVLLAIAIGTFWAWQDRRAAGLE